MRGDGAQVPPGTREYCPVAEPRHSGRVSSLKSPADQGYAADDRPAASFEAVIPPPLPVVVLSVPPMPPVSVDVGTHRREGGTWLDSALGTLHWRKALW